MPFIGVVVSFFMQQENVIIVSAALRPAHSVTCILR